MIGWWSQSRDLGVASVRIRAYLVMQALRQSGVSDVDWYEPGAKGRYQAVVFAKRYDDASQREAERLQTTGCRVIADLCDNHFFNPKGLPEWKRRAEQLRSMLRLADHVVVSTPALADVVRAQCDNTLDVSVIGDLLDDLAAVRVSPAAALRASLKARSLRVATGRLRSEGQIGLVWFGNHGSPYTDGGMLDLLRIRTLLEEMDAAGRQIFLTVISNNRQKYEKHIAPWAVQTFYVEWSPVTASIMLAMHASAVLPIGDNEFTRCKTANRVVTALSHGLAVAADPIPSYEAYRNVILLGEWGDGLYDYVSDSIGRERDTKVGRNIAARTCDSDVIAKAWCRVLGL